ncbi:MAG: tetratricopeptide repeat protein [Burkholderiales bacterium]|nr:tetratricopeptide repeat protein [Burkholderiales bacterium]
MISPSLDINKGFIDVDDKFSAVGSAFRKVVVENVDLARAALVIARIEYPDLDPERFILRLDALAAAVRERMPPNAKTEQQVATLNLYLFTEQQYHGNDADYYDPGNSCLNAVLQCKTGIPITLSLLYMEIARRLGLTVHGIAFPGHFLVRVECERGLIVLDPFNKGQTLNEIEVRHRLAQARGQGYAEMADLGEVLAAASDKELLLRMLRNLKKIYTQRGKTAKAITAISLTLIADPNAGIEWRDRGLLYRELEAFRAALSDLSHYLETTPDAEDGEVVRHLVMELHGINARFN